MGGLLGLFPGRSWGSLAAKAGLERSWRLLGLSRGALGALRGRLLGRFWGLPGDAPGVVWGTVCASFEGFKRKS